MDLRLVPVLFRHLKVVIFYIAIRLLVPHNQNNDDLNGVVVSNADCQSKGPGFESRVSHGPFQKV
jgi:hypothetical protein